MDSVVTNTDHVYDYHALFSLTAGEVVALDLLSLDGPQ